MLEKRYGTFAGGIDLPDDKDQTLDEPIVACWPLSRLVVPLAPADGPPARLLFKPGQYVSHGEKLAAADSPDQVDVFAPLAGKVDSLGQALLRSGRNGWRSSPAVVLTGLDPPAGLSEVQTQYDWQSADAASLRLRLTEGGLLCGGQVLPIGRWLERTRQAGAVTLIGNLMENVPFVTADHAALRDFASGVVRGLAILARALEIRQVLLAVDHRRVNDYRQAAGPARLLQIEALALVHKYPTGAEAMLVRVLTRREAPPGQPALAVGAAVVNGADCLAAYRWVACGQAPTGRVVTVSGPRVQRPGNFYLPFGAEAAEVLACAGARAGMQVEGSPMSGRLLSPGAVVGPATDALLALEPSPPARATQCVRCGWCVEHCPVRINVAILNDDFELVRLDLARRRGAQACIGCGICSYLCPSHLPLTDRVGRLKEALCREGAGSAL